MKQMLLVLGCLWGVMTGEVWSQSEEFEFFPPGKMQTHEVAGITATQYQLVDSGGKVKTGAVVAEDEYVFNQEGLMTLHKMLAGHGYLPKSCEYRYDGAGRRTHLLETTLSQEGKTISTSTTMYAYSESMKPSAVYRYLTRDTGKSKVDVFFLYEFDSLGRIAVERVMTSPRDEKTRKVYQYAPDGSEIQWWVTQGDTSLCKRVFADANGRITRTETPDEAIMKEKGMLEVKYKYDENGLMREQETIWRRDGIPVYKPLFLDTWQYDAYGVLQEKISWQFDDVVKDYVPRAVVKYEYQ